MSFEWIDLSERKPYTGLALPDRELAAREHVSKIGAIVNGNEVQAVGALWLDTPKSPDGATTAFVGHFASTDAGHSKQLLDALATEAARAGRTRILAPIDGSTWRSYRVVVESNGRDAFFLEPQTPSYWEAHLTGAGFKRAEMYASIELTDLAPFAGPDAYAGELAAAGITVRNFDMENFDADLVKLHALSLNAFAANPYYAPLSLEDFAAMYRPAVFLYEPGLALIAERNNEALGFIFAYRDGPQKSCTVLKTIAVSSNIREAGLARHLTGRVLARAHELKCASAIFALMHERNKSFSWGARHGKIFRRYALLAKDL
jgi:GNAT superfamily N-acetyltransferase